MRFKLYKLLIYVGKKEYVEGKFTEAAKDSQAVCTFKAVSYVKSRPSAIPAGPGQSQCFSTYVAW